MNFFDTYLWEPLQRRFPWLYQLDNTDWKTWIWHSAITLFVGFLLGLLPLLTFRTGTLLMAGFYGAREFIGVVFEGNRDYRDALMDALGPALVAWIVW